MLVKPAANPFHFWGSKVDNLLGEYDLQSFQRGNSRVKPFSIDHDDRWVSNSIIIDNTHSILNICIIDCSIVCWQWVYLIIYYQSVLYIMNTIIIGGKSNRLLTMINCDNNSISCYYCWYIYLLSVILCLVTIVTIDDKSCYLDLSV